MPKSRTFEQRMRAFNRQFPRVPLDPIERAALEGQMKMDIGFQMRMQEISEKYDAFVLTRMKGGSGFPPAKILRHFFLEYFSRIVKTGPHAFPTSFNVVESFLQFSESVMAYDLRPEIEHVLRFDDYVGWYTAGSFPNEPAALREIMPEGLVHSYSALAPLEDFWTTSAEGSTLRILGISLVRHGSEVSAITIAGEKPAYPPRG